MTKTKFLAAYEAALKRSYGWAGDAAKLAKFMDSVRATIGIGGVQPANVWNHSGTAVMAAWQEIGGKGVPSLIKLRKLPEV